MSFFGLMLLLNLTAESAGETEWSVVAARWRPDANPFVEQQVWESREWVEGWRAAEQYYPDLFRPAGSLHVVLRNNSGKASSVRLERVDGAEIGSVTTSPRRAGPVVWYFVEPESVPAGDWTACSVRLRSVPAEDVRLSFEANGADAIEVAVPAEAQRFRIESISFSPGIDHIYVYVRSLAGGRVPRGKLRLDGREPGEGVEWTGGPGRGDLALAEGRLSPAWEPGSRHLVEVLLPGAGSLVQPVRAWDSFFEIGLYGVTDEDSVKDAARHGFNTYVVSGPREILDQHGMNYVVSHGVGEGRIRTREQSGTLFYANHDEPDAHDYGFGSDLPLGDRLGVHGQERVIPFIRYQRAQDARTLNMVLVDNTFKPLNWYMYGQMADVLCTDPYVPLSGDQLTRVPESLAVARDACAPHPLTAVLWACRLEGAGHHFAERAPFPNEERMMAFYAVGSGVKGLAYFIDLSSTTGEGTFVGLSDIEELWAEAGRINRGLAALSPYLSIGCPVPGGYEDEQVWARLLMCGRDNLVLVVVNKNHFIHFNTRTTYARHEAAADAEVRMELPAHGGRWKVRELADGGFRPVEAKAARGMLRLFLDRVDTGRAFLLSISKER